MKISFLIPAFNSSTTLQECIESIINQKGNFDKKIIIINDGSKDKTLEVANKLSSKYNCINIINKQHGGESSALNVGLLYVEGELIAIIESDVKLFSDWLEKIISGFKEKKVVGIGGRLITSKTDPWIARIAGYEVERKFKNKKDFPNHITSANVIYRKEVFEKYGKFNEKLLNSCLDADLNLRIIRGGDKLKYEKEAIAEHHFKKSFIEYLKRQYMYARYRPYLKCTNLYNEDKNIRIQMILTIFFFFSLPIIKFSILPSILLLISIFFFNSPFFLEILFKKKDWVCILVPPVMFLRNIVGIIGYTIGWFIKKLNKNG